MEDDGLGEESLRGIEIMGRFVLMGTKVGLRRRAGRSGISSAVNTGTDDERGGPMPVRIAARTIPKLRKQNA